MRNAYAQSGMTASSRINGAPRRARPEHERETVFYGRKFVVQTQTSAKPRGLVVFEYLVLLATAGSLAYLLFAA